MSNRDPRIDAYIAGAAEFARPLLMHLRDVVHATCPEVEEGIKWSMPFFSYRGAPMCMMAAFKQHCGFGFWRGREVVGESAEEGMGQFGKLASLDDLPPERALAAYIGKAMALSEAGTRPVRAKVAPRPAPPVPDDLAAALAQKHHAAARTTYRAFSPAAQREYVEWITSAKTEPTRRKRLADALAWMAEGKQRNWKYRK